MTYKVGLKGQVVLPKSIRERVGISPGDEVTVAERGGAIQISKALSGPAERAAVVAGLRGALIGAPPLTVVLERDRRTEREREERRRVELHSDDRP
jgi:AbrB family looped-hinge helix DNA binding protein